MKKWVIAALAIASSVAMAEEINYWQDDRGVDNYTHFDVDEYGLKRQNDVEIDYGHSESKDKIRRFITGTWMLPENPTAGDVVVADAPFESRVTYSADGTYQERYTLESGYVMTFDGNWSFDREGNIWIRGTLNALANQTPLSFKYRVHYIDNQMMVSTTTDGRGYKVQAVKVAQ